MLKFLKDKMRTTWYALSQVPQGFFAPWRREYFPGERPSGACGYEERRCVLSSPEQALTLSPFWAALRLYQNAIAVLPLCTYSTDEDGGRSKIADKSLYGLLHDRPNPAMSRAAFFEFALREYFLQGEFFALIRWANNHRLLGLYPIHASRVSRIDIDDEWQKVYHVTGFDEPILDSEMLHIVHTSHCGFRGTPFIRYAAESLSLHKQVLDSATAYYANAAKPSGYLSYPSTINKDKFGNIKDNFLKDYQGVGNTGKVPILSDGGTFNTFPNTAAADAQIVEAIGASVDDIARWFDNLSPLTIGNLSRGTYSNSAADKLAFYQKNLLPVLEKFQLEINYKLFGVGSDTYAEFLTDAVLRADPKTQADVWHLGIQDGYILRSECRQWLNLSPVPGLDSALQPMNMTNPETTPETPPTQEGDATDGQTTVDPVTTDA